LLFVLLYLNAEFVYLTVLSNKVNRQRGRLLITYDVRFSHNICIHDTTTYSLATMDPAVCRRRGHRRFEY